jgi:hypothetical protein
MKTIQLRNRAGFILLVPALVWIAGCASSSTKTQTGVEPAARELLDSVSARLGPAHTIQVEAEQKVAPPLGLGLPLDHGRIELAVERPNRFYAIQPAGRETREVAYDGKSLCIMYPGQRHYALEPMEAGTIEQFAQLTDERFGFRPPVAELLASDMTAEFLQGVTSARVLGTESIGWTHCEHLRLEQEGMIVELWVGAKDRLPHRLLITCTDIQGKPTWNIRFSKWELNAPLDETLFSKRPAAGSLKVQMVKSR